MFTKKPPPASDVSMAETEESMAHYKELLTCVICLDTLKDEKMLPCSHMFCLECLEGYVKFNREVKCPECRMTHQIPSGGVKSFPKNVRLRQFLDKLCPGCSKNPKTDSCPHCREQLCSKCKDQHIEVLRKEVGEKIGQIEGLNDGNIVKEVKREKKMLKDKEKLVERDITKVTEDLIKTIKNREKKLKADAKAAFKADNDELDSQLKKHQDTINSLRSFGKKSDLAKLSVTKLTEMKEKWPEWEAQIPSLQEGLKTKSCNVQLTFHSSQIGTALKQNWHLHADDNCSDTSSIISDLEPPSPMIHRAPTVVAPSLIFGEKGSALGRLNSPFRVCISPKTNYFVAVDTQNDRVQTFDTTGKYVSSYGFTGKGQKQFNHPIGIFITSSGQHIVADAKNHRIEVMDADGMFLRAFGKEGSGNGEFNQPWDIILDSKKILHVSDCVNNRIQILTTDGRHIRTVGERKLSNPTGMAIDKNGDIFVADCENHRIQVFSQSGHLKSTIGREGQKAGELSYPDGLILDKDDNIVVAEWGNHRVQVFTKTGKSVRILGSHGSGPGEFQNPRGVTMTSDGRLVVCDCGNNRIQVF